jgi:hypothetical protein
MDVWGGFGRPAAQEKVFLLAVWLFEREDGRCIGLWHWRGSIVCCLDGMVMGHIEQPLFAKSVDEIEKTQRSHILAW